MPKISKIQLPSGTVYDLADSRVDNINSFDYIVSTNAANTPKDVTWDDGGTTITGTLVAASTTMYKIYLVPSSNGTNDIYDEYITVNTTGTTYKWEMFGNTKLPDMTQYVKNASGHSGGTAGELAYKSSASGSYTPAGTVSQPTFTGSSSTVTISSSASSSGNYQPAGTISQPTFSGSSLTSTGKFTPSGSVSLTDTNKTAAVSPASSGTATYTPAGSVSTPTITVTPATTTKYVASSASGGGTVTAGTAASCTMPTYTVASGSETLVISAGSFTANTPTAVTLPTFASQTIATGITSATSTQPSFTGTGVRLVTDNIAVPTSASFSGSEGNVSVSGTPTGTVSQPTFTGTKVQLSGSTTAAGTVSQPTFSGTAATITVS